MTLSNWLHTMCRQWRADSGAAALEFALVLPVLLLILFAIVQFGALFSIQNTMTNASREAARAMAVDGLSATQAEALADRRLGAWGGLAFQIDAAGPDPADRDVAVTISVPARDAVLVDVLGIFTGTLSAQTIMREE